MAEKLHINLLGGFYLEYEGNEVKTVKSPRLRHLFAFLLLHRDKNLARHHVAFLFWPDSSEKQALTNLRNLLYLLRNELPDPDQFLMINQKTLKWNTDSSYSFDVEKFSDCMEQAEQEEDMETRISLLKLAISLYKGSLLPECYKRWIEKERDRLASKYDLALKELVNALEEKRSTTDAIRYARKRVRNTPLNESAWRKLMKLNAIDNNRAAALEAYRNCMEVFNEELNIEPSDETKKVYKRILSSYKEVKRSVPKPTPEVQTEEWPLVGRDREWQSILKCWKQALGGQIQFLLIEGEPGIGKSRLGIEFMNSVRRQGYPVAYSRCYKAAGPQDFGPIIDWLNEGSIYNNLSKLDKLWLTELVRLLPELLITHPGLSDPGPVTGSLQRRKLFKAIIKALLIDKKARLLFLDDLQWCDKQTVRWINFLFHNVQEGNLMLITSCRPTEAKGNPYVQKLLEDQRRRETLCKVSLSDLNENETNELVSKVAGQPVDKRLKKKLYVETNGHPLFVVEMARSEDWLMTIDDSNNSGDGTSKKKLPRKVTEFISSRFQHLSPSALKVMEFAAVVGRESSIELLREGCNIEEQLLVESLEELHDHHILQESLPGNYDFTHDKLREVAYQGLSKVRKQYLHKKVAETMEILNEHDLQGLQGRLAWHYEQAGHGEKAANYYDQATAEARRILIDLEDAGHTDRTRKLLDEFQKPLTDAAITDKITSAFSRKFGRMHLTLWLVGMLALAFMGWILFFGGPPKPNIDSLVVLPLKNLSGDLEQKYLIDGITEALTTELGQLDVLKVISGYSAQYYADSDKSASEIARELDVDGVVTGSVFSNKRRVRINIELIEADTDQNIWAESYERDIYDALSLQSEITRDIARQIENSIGLEKSNSFDQASSVNPKAYKAFLKGQYFLGKERSDKENLKKSLGFFREALDIDPTYAPAYAAMADCYWELHYWGYIEFSEAHNMIEAALQKAIELDEGLAEAHTAMAIYLFWYKWNWTAAEKELQRALELNPNSAATYWEFGQQLVLMRRFEEAVAIKERMVELDPLNGWYQVNLAWTYSMAGHFQKAIDLLKNSRELFPNNENIHMILALAYTKIGKYGKAVIEADKAVLAHASKEQYDTADQALVDSTALTPSDKSILGWVYVKANREEITKKLLKWAIKLEENGASAVLYAQLGYKQKALDSLENAYEEHAPIIPFINLLQTWLLEPISEEQRFQIMLKQLNFPES